VLDLLGSQSGRLRLYAIFKRKRATGSENSIHRQDKRVFMSCRTPAVRGCFFSVSPMMHRASPS
jgi:hypothetical protein